MIILSLLYGAEAPAPAATAEVASRAGGENPQGKIEVFLDRDSQHFLIEQGQISSSWYPLPKEVRGKSIANYEATMDAPGHFKIRFKARDGTEGSIDVSVLEFRTSEVYSPTGSEVGGGAPPPAAQETLTAPRGSTAYGRVRTQPPQVLSEASVPHPYSYQQPPQSFGGVPTGSVATHQGMVSQQFPQQKVPPGFSPVVPQPVGQPYFQQSAAAQFVEQQLYAPLLLNTKQIIDQDMKRHAQSEGLKWAGEPLLKFNDAAYRALNPNLWMTSEAAPARPIMEMIREAALGLENRGVTSGNFILTTKIRFADLAKLELMRHPDFSAERIIATIMPQLNQDIAGALKSPQ